MKNYKNFQTQLPISTNQDSADLDELSHENLGEVDFEDYGNEESDLIQGDFEDEANSSNPEDEDGDNDKAEPSTSDSAKLPSNENFDLYIVINVSGDSELVYLITMKDGKLIADLEIGNSNGDSDEIKVFSITEKYEVFIYSEKNGKRKLIETFSLDNHGSLVEQRAH